MSRSLDGGSSRSERSQNKSGERVTRQDYPDARRQQRKPVYHFCGHNYHLSQRQTAMLRDIGAFRTITAESLQKHVYRGDEDRFRKDLRNLKDCVPVRNEKLK